MGYCGSGVEMRVALCIRTFKDDFDGFKYCFEDLLKNSGDVDKIFVVYDADHADERYDVYFDSILLNNIRLIEKRDFTVNDLVEHLGNLNFDLVVLREEVGLIVKRT